MIVANWFCKLVQANELPGKMRKSLFEGSYSLQQLTLRHTLGLTLRKLLRCSRTTPNSEGGCLQGGQGPELERVPGWYLIPVLGSG